MAPNMANALGIGSLVIGVALVCGGLIMWPRASETDPAAPDDGLRGMRAVVEALEEEDRAAERGAIANVRPRLDSFEDKKGDGQVHPSPSRPRS
jgi:hypothetical protein